MNGRYYIGHVGDSRVVFGLTIKNSLKNSTATKTKNQLPWVDFQITNDHKTNVPSELARIKDAGGQVMKDTKGTSRVVYHHPLVPNPTEPPMTSPHLYKTIPCLAMTRALGNFWSINKWKDVFVVSPIPDVHCFPIQRATDKCFVLATDGLWDIMSNKTVISNVQNFTSGTSMIQQGANSSAYSGTQVAHHLVNKGLQMYKSRRQRADNITVLVVVLSSFIHETEPTMATSNCHIAK